MGICLSSRRKPEPPQLRKKRLISQYPPVFSFTSEPFQFPSEIARETAEATEVDHAVANAQDDIPPPPPPKDLKPQRSVTVAEPLAEGTDDEGGGVPGSPLARTISNEGDHDSVKDGSSQTMVESENASNL